MGICKTPTKLIRFRVACDKFNRDTQQYNTTIGILSTIYKGVEIWRDCQKWYFVFTDNWQYFDSLREAKKFVDNWYRD